MLFESIKQCRGKAEVAFLEFFRVLGTVYSGEVEYEIGFLAVAIEFFRSRVDVVLEHLVYLDGIVLRLAVLYVIELGAKILTNKALCSGY